MFEKGTIINGRYEVKKLIGEGGMANVYLGYDKILERNVAIKVLRGDLSDDEKFIRRFKREAQSASLLNHPNIVQIYDVGEENGNFYIVMEYIKGETLKQLIKKRGHLSIPEVIDITSQLTDGLSSAHDSYIIHRDIKPQNIMVLSDGMVKITDFGIAMALNASELTQTDSVMGSVHYLPPEQAAGKGSTIKSDIYSIGILMYEMLVGTMPFRGDSAVEIALKHIKEPLPSIRKVNPKVPQALENVVIKCTAKNPKNRYNDVRELYDDLKTSISDKRKDEKRITFKYAENDMEETKVMKNLSDEIVKKENKDTEKLAVKEIDNEEFPDKMPKQTKILLTVIGFLVFGFLFMMFVFPLITKTPDRVVPDVTGMTVPKATTELQKKGFKVNEDVEEDYNEEVKKGRVSKTSPGARQTVKKGATITLYKSLGSEKIVIKDYTNKDSNTIKAELKVKGLDVEIEEKDVDNKADYIGKESLIIDQSVKKGESLVKGDMIILYIPNVKNVYPDFVTDGWTRKEVEEFCSEYNIKLTVEDELTDEIEEGKVTYQSRPKDSTIAKNSSLKIKVAKPSGKTINEDDLVPYVNEDNNE